MKMPFVNNKPIRLIELFGGIGSQAMALSRLGVNFEHYRLVEFLRLNGFSPKQSKESEEK